VAYLGFCEGGATVGFVTLILRNLLMEVILALLVMGQTLPIFTRGKNDDFGLNFRQDSQLTAYYSTTGWNIKNRNIALNQQLLGYIHTKFDGGRLKSNAEIFLQTGMGYLIFGRPSMRFIGGLNTA